MTSLPRDFDRFFAEHAAFVYRTAYGVTGRHEDAEDVLQTVFLRLVRGELSPDLLKSPKAYLYRAAVNVSLDMIQQRRRDVVVDGAALPDLPAPTPDSVDDDHHRRLYQAIAQLKPAAAQILILRYVHDKSDAEIAKLLGVSRGTIALRLFRSRARLKKLLCALQGGNT